MLRTLQLYISRELLKTFALTAIGLTLTFSLTGSVFNMIKAEVLTAVQMLHLMMLVLPLSLTLTLPVSALFSCAMVYGRLAADNEFDACRASGINIHRLLVPAFLLSVLTCVFSFIFINYVLPRSIRQVEAIVQKDLQKIVVSALSVQGHFKYGPLIVYAPEPPSSSQVSAGTQVEIDSAAFMRVDTDNQRLQQVGTADKVRVVFWTDPQTGAPVAQPDMLGVRAFDLDQNRVLASLGQEIPPLTISGLFADQKTKWLNLPQLLKYKQNPIGLQPVQKHLTNLRGQVRKDLFYKYLVDELSSGRVLRLDGTKDKPQYEIHAQRAEKDQKDFRPQLEQVTVIEHIEGHVREYTAERCSVKVEAGSSSIPWIVRLRLTGKVSFTDTRSSGQHLVEAARELDAVPLPQEFTTKEKNLSDLDLLGLTNQHLRLAGKGKFPNTPPPSVIDVSNTADHIRLRALNEMIQQSLKVICELHSRLAFSTSVLVMLVLAAALAIIFRGGQLLTAFVISFLPGLLVVVMNIAGRQLAEKPPTHLVGLLVIWAGIGLIAVADVVVLSKFLRR